MIIGLNGLKGSGKDSVADILVEKYEFEKLSFAKKLKESVANLFQISQNEIEEWKNNDNVLVKIDAGRKFRIISFRTFLQRYGTEAHRNVFGQDFWVEQAMKNIDLNENYVVPDCRFINEINKIHSLKGFVVQVLRPNIESDGHASEMPPPNHLIDFTLKNNGTLDDLEETVDLLVEELNYWKKLG